MSLKKRNSIFSHFERAIIGSFSFCLLASAAMSAIINNEALKALPDNGETTCAFVNFFSNHSDSAQICSATVVSQNQIVMNDSNCFHQSALRNPRMILSCRGDKIRREFRQGLDYKSENGRLLVHLPERMDVQVPKKVQTRAQRESLLRAGQCEVRSLFHRVPMKGENGQTQFEITGENNQIKVSSGIRLNGRAEGGNLSCRDENGQEILLGTLNKKLEIRFFDELPEISAAMTTDHAVTAETSLAESYHNLCLATGECLDQLSRDAVNLAELTLNILQHYSVEYDDVKARSFDLAKSSSEEELEVGINSMMKDLREILVTCQEIVIGQIHRNDHQIEGGFFQNTKGATENLMLGIGSLFSSNITLSEFEAVPILRDNLSSEKMAEIIARVDQNHGSESRIRRVALSAKEMGREVIRHFITEMQIQSENSSTEEIIDLATTNFDACLEQAVNSGQIKDCADRLSLSAPALLARYELEDQLKNNYQKLFKNADGVLNEEAFQALRAEALAVYQNCLINYYYKDRTSAEPVDRAKACVFESMIRGYEIASSFQVDQTLLPLISDPRELRAHKAAIRQAAHQCSLGSLFHSSGKLNATQYHTLARLSVPEFKVDLLKCTDNLSYVVGERAVGLTVAKDAAFSKNIPAGERTEYLRIVSEDYYKPCMLRQHSRTDKHPKNCEAMITQMVTLDISERILNRTLNEQISPSGAPFNTKQTEISNRVSTDIKAKMETCRQGLKERHLAYLAAADSPVTQPTDKDIGNCLSAGIGEIAAGVTALKLSEAISGTPLLANYKDQIERDARIQALPELVRNCFETALQKAESARQMEHLVDQISNQCTLTATQEATLISAEFVLQDRLKDTIKNDSERERFINEYLSETGGLNERVRTTKTQAELDAIVDTITPEVTLRFASTSIPSLVDQYLGEKSTPARRQELTSTILRSLQTCMDGANQEKCVNETTAVGYKLITSELINDTIASNISGAPAVVQRLQNDSKARMQQCVEQVDKKLEDKNYTASVNLCVANEVYTVSQEIPKEISLQFSLLLGSSASQNDLRQRMTSIQRTGRLTPAQAQDPSVRLFSQLHSCLETQKTAVHPSAALRSPAGLQTANLKCNSSLRMRSGPTTTHTILGSIPCQTAQRSTQVSVTGQNSGGWTEVNYNGLQGYVSSNYLTLGPVPVAPIAQANPSVESPEIPAVDLDVVQDAYAVCTNQFESQVKNQIRTAFIERSYPGRRPSHQAAIEIAGDLLLNLTGKDDPNKQSASSPAETLKLLNMIGGLVITSCNYDSNQCMANLREARTRLSRYKEQNPNATSTQLQSQFLQTPFVNLAVEATVADTLKKELNAALQAQMDPGGVLRNKINLITSPAIMRQIMTNRYGQAATQYIRNAILSGKSDGITEDKRLRAILASAVTDNLGNGGFVDELMYGLVQPELEKQKGSFKVGIGNLFGIVKTRDFDWNRVRNTPHGNEARRLFARELLEPVFQGVQVSRTPSSTNPRKSQQDDVMERITALIESGVKGLSR